MNNKEGGFIQNIVIIVAILAAIFLSQQSFLKGNSKNWIYSQNQKSNFLDKAGNWLNNNVLSKVSGEVGTIKDNATKEITTQKNNLEKSSTNTVKNFIAEKLLQTMGVNPQDLVTPTQTPLTCPK